MNSPLVVGFLACFTLIAAIGAQNAFVLRQGIQREHVLPVVALCTVSDIVLIAAGIAGFGALHTWNSTVARSGTHYVLSPANWNRIIAPGGSATGGLRGGLTGSYSPPSSCLLNGQYPCT